MGAAASAGTGDDIREAIAVDVAGRHINAAVETCIEGHEFAQQFSVGSIKDSDVRTAAGSRAGDDVGCAVAVDVAGGDADASPEARIVGEEAKLLRACGI